MDSRLERDGGTGGVEGSTSNGDIGRRDGREGLASGISSSSKDTLGRGGVAVKESGVVALDESFLVRRQNEGRRETAFSGGVEIPDSGSYSRSFPFASKLACVGPSDSPLLRFCSTISDRSEASGVSFWKLFAFRMMALGGRVPLDSEANGIELTSEVGEDWPACGSPKPNATRASANVDLEGWRVASRFDASLVLYEAEGRWLEGVDGPACGSSPCMSETGYPGAL